MTLSSSHPKPVELLRYAEGLEDGHVHMAPEVVRHVADCAECRSEVEAMRFSLCAIAQSTPIEPTTEWTAQVVTAARREGRRKVTKRYTRPAMAAAAALIVASVIGAIRIAPGRTPDISETAAVPSSAPVAIENRAVAFASDTRSVGVALLSETVEEEVLGDALLDTNRPPSSAWEAAHLSAIRELDANIEEGLAALASNPGLVRARLLVNASREQKRELLKTLYLERSL